MSSRILIFVETVAIAAFFVLIGVHLFTDEPRSNLPKITKEALASDSLEKWNGIFFAEQQVGYSLNRKYSYKDGSMDLDQRYVFQMPFGGRVLSAIIATSASIGKNGEVKQFDLYTENTLGTFSGRGIIQDKTLILEFNQNGNQQTMTFDIDKPPQVAQSIETIVQNKELAAGQKFSVPYFDPQTQKSTEMEIVVEGNAVLENNEEAWWINAKGASNFRALITPEGDILRQEGSIMGFGLSMVRMTQEQARDLDQKNAPKDIRSLSTAPLKGKLKNPREISYLQVTPSTAAFVSDFGDHQTKQGTDLIIKLPALDDISPTTVAAKPNEWTKSSPFIFSKHQDIIARAKQETQTAQTRQQAVQALLQFVATHMETIPSFSIPDGLQALRSAEGNADAHTSLFVSLSRALGIPTKIVSGIVFTNKVDPQSTFHYHSWAEIQFGDTWLPVDPTFNQFPADATHIKFFENTFAKQVEILSILNRLSFQLVQAH